MTGAINRDQQTVPTQENRCAATHPAWCDPHQCTAEPAAPTRSGYQTGDAGEHRSTSIALDLGAAYWLPAREGVAWLSEACAPWSCAPYLRIRVGNADLSIPADQAGQVLDALMALVDTARLEPEVTR